MNQSRGRLYFHRLFSIEELGFRDPEPFLAPLIREFLKIGEAVAGRWIEMPQAVLLFQIVFGQPDSGAIYLYDRRLRVFYMLGFDGPDDHLTLEEFEQLSEEYNLVRFAEQPALIEQQPAMPETFPQPVLPVVLQRVALSLAPHEGERLTVKLGEWWQAKPNVKQVWCQTTGTA